MREEIKTNHQNDQDLQNHEPAEDAGALSGSEENLAKNLEDKQVSGHADDETDVSLGETDDSELTNEEKALKQEALEELTAPNIKHIIEGLLFVSDEPVTMDKFKQVLGARTKPQVVRDFIAELKEEYDEASRGFMIIEVANGFQMATRAEYAHWLTKLYKGKKERFLSKSSLETLSIVSYRQPITRAEIEAIRGVNVDGVIKTLLDRNLIKIVGKKEVPGRPMLYGTTKRFLEYFGLKALEDLPGLPDSDPEEEKKIRESLRRGDQIDDEDKGLREQQPIVEDYEETLSEEDQENASAQKSNIEEDSKSDG